VFAAVLSLFQKLIDVQQTLIKAPNPLKISNPVILKVKPVKI
jgi:hypothetical protein